MNELFATICIELLGIKITIDAVIKKPIINFGNFSHKMIHLIWFVCKIVVKSAIGPINKFWSILMIIAKCKIFFELNKELLAITAPVLSIDPPIQDPRIISFISWKLDPIYGKSGINGIVPMDIIATKMFGNLFARGAAFCASSWDFSSGNRIFATEKTADAPHIEIP